MKFLCIILLVILPLTAENKESDYVSYMVYQKEYVTEDPFIEKMIDSLSNFEMTDSMKLDLIAQAALESNYGRCKLSKYNNVFGIKGKGIQTNTKEYINNELVIVKQSFQTFETLEECIERRLQIKTRNYATAPDYWNVVKKVRKNICKKIEIKTKTGFIMTKKEQIKEKQKQLEQELAELEQFKDGIVRNFDCPFGSRLKYQLRIYKSLLTNQTNGMELHDFNESYELWRNGDQGVIVVKDV